MVSFVQYISDIYAAGFICRSNWFHICCCCCCVWLL